MINMLRSLMEKVYNIQEQMTKVRKVSLKAVKRNARKKNTNKNEECHLQVHQWTQKG